MDPGFIIFIKIEKDACLDFLLSHDKIHSMIKYLIHYDIVDPTINIFNTIELPKIDKFINFGRKILGGNWFEDWEKYGYNLFFSEYITTTTWEVGGMLTYKINNAPPQIRTLRSIKCDDIYLLDNSYSQYKHIQIKTLRGLWIYHLYKNKLSVTGEFLD